MAAALPAGPVQGWNEEIEMVNRFAGTVRAPEFPAGLDWFNSAPLTLSALRGKIAILDFWTYC